MKKIIFSVYVAMIISVASGDFFKNGHDQDREIREFVKEMQKETVSAINAIGNEKNGHASTQNLILITQASDYSLSLNHLVNYIQKLMITHQLSWTPQVVIEVNPILKRLIRCSYNLQNVIIAKDGLLKSYFKVALQSATNEIEKLAEIACTAQDSYDEFVLKQDIKVMLYYYVSFTGKIAANLNAQTKTTQDIYRDIQDITNDVIDVVKKMKEGVKDVPDFVMYLGMQLNDIIPWLQYWVNWDPAGNNTGAKIPFQDVTTKIIDLNQRFQDLSTAMSYTNDTKDFNQEIINSLKGVVLQTERMFKLSETMGDDLLGVGLIRSAMTNILSGMRDLKRELSISA